MDAYLSYCKVYVTKQSGISLTIIPFTPRLGIAGLGVRCQPPGPWHQGGQGCSLAWQEGESAAGQEQGPGFPQMDPFLCIQVWAPHRALPSWLGEVFSTSGEGKGKPHLIAIVNVYEALHYFPEDVVTNDPKPGGLKQQKFIHSPGGQKCEMKVWSGPHSLQSPGEKPAGPFQLLGLHNVRLCFCLHRAFSVSSPSLPSPKDTCPGSQGPP